MDNMIYILFVSISIPLIMMSMLLEGKAKKLLLFFVLGSFLAVFAAEINGMILKYSDFTLRDFTSRIAPITEEILKALPILFYALVITDRKGELGSFSLGCGIGFAVLENAYVLIQNIEGVSIFWAIMRGFGTGMMHGMCTMLIGVGIVFLKKRKKIFAVGIFALLSVSIIYHSIFNMLVQTSYRYIGTLLPILTYLPFVFVRYKRKTNK